MELFGQSTLARKLRLGDVPGICHRTFHREIQSKGDDGRTLSMRTRTEARRQGPPFPWSLFIRLLRPRQVRRLLIERLPIPNAALHELRPCGDHRQRVRLFWQ